MTQTGVYKLSKGPDKKERTNRDEHVEMQKLRCLLNKKCAIFSTTQVSDWFKHQILKNIRKAACIY